MLLPACRLRWRWPGDSKHAQRDLRVRGRHAFWLLIGQPTLTIFRLPGVAAAPSATQPGMARRSPPVIVAAPAGIYLALQFPAHFGCALASGGLDPLVNHVPPETSPYCLAGPWTAVQLAIVILALVAAWEKRTCGHPAGAHRHSTRGNDY